MQGTYLQQTVESVVGNETGKQLMVRIQILVDLFDCLFLG